MTVELLPISHRSDRRSGVDYVAIQPQIDSPEERPLVPKNSFQNKLNNWVLEIACCVGFLAALGAIIGVLLAYDKKSIPEWPYGITVNTVLSLLSLILNACLVGVVASCLGQWKWNSFNATQRPLADINVYDSASRGVLGCITFLGTTNLRQYATIGAVATILAAGNGPFIQQMATVENNRVLSNVAATVARAQSYSYIPSGNTAGNEPPNEMIGAIYASVFNCLNSDCSVNSSRASYSTVIPSCPTGECDFPPLTTLAVCSECSDISHMLSHSTKSCQSRDRPLNRYSLPNGLNTSFYSNWNPATVFLNGVTGSAATRMRSIARLPNYGNTTLVDFTALKYRPGSKSSVPVVNATQCVLHWCIKSISVNMTGNKLRESHLDTWTDEPPYNTSQFLRLSPPRDYRATIPDFTINPQSGVSESSELGIWLASKLKMNSIGSVDCTGETDDNLSVTDFTQPMALFPVSKLFENIAAGMTISVRRSGRASQSNLLTFADQVADGGEDGRSIYHLGAAYRVPLDEDLGFANGTSYKVETQIRVRWAWITFPAALMAITMGFLAVTILQTRRAGVPLFKSSSIPLLCSGLDNDIQDNIRHVKDPVAMDDLSRTVIVKFIKNEDTSWGMVVEQTTNDQQG